MKASVHQDRRLFFFCGKDMEKYKKNLFKSKIK